MSRKKRQYLPRKQAYEIADDYRTFYRRSAKVKRNKKGYYIKVGKKYKR